MGFIKSFGELQFYKENIFNILVILIPMLIGIDYIKNLLDKKWYYWVVVILVFLISSLSNAYSFENKKNLQEKNSKLEERNQNLSATLESIPIDMIKTLGKEIGIGNYERITLYRVESNDINNTFIPVARFSDNPIFKEYGRGTYPSNKGYIGKVWTEGEISVSGLPEYDSDKRRYIAESKRVGMRKEEIENLSMKSRSFYGKRLHYNGDEAIAILIIESMSEFLPFQKEKINEFLVGAYGKILIDSVQKNIVVGREVDT